MNELERTLNHFNQLKQVYQQKGIVEAAKYDLQATKYLLPLRVAGLIGPFVNIAKLVSAACEERKTSEQIKFDPVLMTDLGITLETACRNKAIDNITNGKYQKLLRQ